ncbi:MAG: TRAP transporter small permease subunit [Synergistaceae bacterium]|nr:TRAP transporter small permease subunit [Synergistaceae bacterium]
MTLMVYMAVLSATLAIRRGAHIRMTAFDPYLPKGFIKFLDVLADVAVLALGVVMLVYGIKVCNSPLARFGRYESIRSLSRVWMYLPIPVAGAGMIIFELEQIFRHIEAFYIKDEDKQEAKA